MRYRRAFTPGGTFFFTVVTWQRRPILRSAAAVATLRSAFRHVQRRHPFTVNAAVVLPDHLHCLWTLPPDEADFAVRWRLIKSWFTRQRKIRTGHVTDATRRSQPAWQKRYWEHLIRDEADLTNHLDYIHYNPVKHGWAECPADWPYSSFHRHVADGHYPVDWGTAPIDCGAAGHE
ncbi:MAG TPA: transposase [Oleiagrimonas sp.]|nr:transposase [Oleiagrimonas sp.]